MSGDFEQGIFRHAAALILVPDHPASQTGIVISSNGDHRDDAPVANEWHKATSLAGLKSQVMTLKLWSVRRFDMPFRIRLDQLHDSFGTVFGCANRHLCDSSARDETTVK